MGKEHPPVWSHCVGRGPALHSALDHPAASHGEPKHLEFIERAIARAAGFEGQDCTAGSQHAGKP